MNNTKHNPWAECDKLRAENERLTRELEAARKVAEAAVNYMAALDKQNYGAVVCFGWEHAKTVIETYLRYGPPLGEGVK